MQTANDLDQLHHRNGIEEVHADHLLRPLRPRGDLCDRDGAGVARKNRFRSQEAVELAKDFGLDVKPLGRGFDREQGGRKVLQAGRQRNARASLIRLFLRQLLLRHLACDVRPDSVEAAIK